MVVDKRWSWGRGADDVRVHLYSKFDTPGRADLAGEAMLNKKTSHETPRKWTPTPKQKAVFEAAQSPDNRTITAICKRAKVDRKTLWRWWEGDEEFRKAWNDLWKFQIDRHMNPMVAGQVKKALAGNTRAFEAVVTLGGKMVRKVDVTSAGEPLKGIDEERFDRAVGTLADAIREGVSDSAGRKDSEMGSTK